MANTKQSEAPKQRATRAKLSRLVVLATGVELADRDGLESLTIRSLASELGAKPMSLYRHVESKEALLDGMVDRVIAEMEPASAELEWREAILRRCESARAALIRHPWAIPLLESRSNPGPELLRHHEATLAALTRGGLPLWCIAHAYALLDSFVYGFAMQEAYLGVGESGGESGGEGDSHADTHAEEVAGSLEEMLDPAEFPHLLRFASEHAMQPGYSFGASFEVGIELILDGVERLAAA
ncbi:TetR/AcrR family transcriptional regulator [Demequina sp. NBRC 110056]|uniref:TetR/AcrR family transcriptional regulator n=1 Tax=Demequina sp. NBRC 110056 TaxID=1570345 RepID=UPI001F30E225|nr:TetR/AcrR family transcriptional regulator C-terminal domain-containing protein [Demequina sp. NBRC 110056]